MSTKQPFKNQTILITGASSGLGSEFARQLVQGGANVGLIARRESQLQELVDQISGTGPKVAFAVADVGDRDLLKSAISELKSSLNIERFDRVILNAGVGKTFRAKDFNAQILEEMTRVNFFTEVLHQPTLSHCQATSTAAILTSSFRSCLEHRLLTTELPQTLPPGLTPRSVVNEIRTDICVRMIRPVPTSVSAAVHSSTPVHTNTASCSGHKSQP